MGQLLENRSTNLISAQEKRARFFEAEGRTRTTLSKMRSGNATSTLSLRTDLRPPETSLLIYIAKKWETVLPELLSRLETEKYESIQ